ncbi:MAG: tryptophan halogenase family protein [Pirellulales bacterium]
MIGESIKSVCILGGGSAGFLSAVALRRLLPGLDVTLVHSPNVPVIGVGESTTAYLPVFLHERLGLDVTEFYTQVVPSWKLGIRFHWGAPEDSHFNYAFEFSMNQEGPPLRKRSSYYCLEDWYDAGPFSAAMDRALSPCQFDGSQFTIRPGFGYHLQNQRFIAYLHGKAEQLGTNIISADMVDVALRDDGSVNSIRLADGRDISADLFIDASGFRSLLLGQRLGEPFLSYDNAIFCDSAVVGYWQRDDVVLPYTTVDTMENGWCWRIDFLDEVSRGYVFCSQFCDPPAAMDEMKRNNPLLGDDLQLIKFRTGRYENFWSRNVVAIGNSSGFVEPLEATALHMLAAQLDMLCGSLADSNLRISPQLVAVMNGNFREKWDDIRDCLALHYRYNRRLDTPFWRHCRQNSELGNAQPLVDFYQVAGPTIACSNFIPDSSIFGYNGYMNLLIQQRISTEYRNDFSPADLAVWDEYRNTIRAELAHTLPARQALKMLLDPNFRWPTPGV